MLQTYSFKGVFYVTLQMSFVLCFGLLRKKIWLLSSWMFDILYLLAANISCLLLMHTVDVPHQNN